MTDQKHAVSSFGKALRSALEYAIFVPAIVVAMIGLWLIVWIALKLI